MQAYCGKAILAIFSYSFHLCMGHTLCRFRLKVPTVGVLLPYILYISLRLPKSDRLLDNLQHTQVWLELSFLLSLRLRRRRILILVHRW
jgi:hypothetical protein